MEQARPLALISGGLGDIGQAIARELAGRGADIALSDLAPAETADSALGTLRARGVRARYETVDIADKAAVAAWVDTVAAEWGTPTWILPNAAQVTLKPLLEITADEWTREIAVNLSGAFFLAQRAVQRLVAAELPGRVVFVGSWAAEAIHSSLPAYCITKAGLRMLMRSLALEAAPHGILVNEVAPGYVDAGLSARIFSQRPEIRDRARAQVPTGLLTHPDEVARQVGWLCDPANRQQTGTTLLMDGGLSLVTPAHQRDA